MHDLDCRQRFIPLKFMHRLTRRNGLNVATVKRRSSYPGLSRSGKKCSYRALGKESVTFALSLPRSFLVQPWVRRVSFAVTRVSTLQGAILKATYAITTRGLPGITLGKGSLLFALFLHGSRRMSRSIFIVPVGQLQFNSITLSFNEN